MLENHSIASTAAWLLLSRTGNADWALAYTKTPNNRTAVKIKHLWLQLNSEFLVGCWVTLNPIEQHW